MRTVVADAPHAHTLVISSDSIGRFIVSSFGESGGTARFREMTALILRAIGKCCALAFGTGNQADSEHLQCLGLL